MKRKFLEELGLEKDAIDKIMAENGKDIEGMKAELQKTETQLGEYDKQLKEMQQELGKFKEMDIEAVQNKVAELKTKYDEDTAALKQKLEQQAYEHATDELLSGIEFTSNSAKQAIKKQIIEKGLKMEEGKILGADDLLKAQRESDPGAFKVIEDDTDPKPKFSHTTKSNGAGGKGEESVGLGAALAERFNK